MLEIDGRQLRSAETDPVGAPQRVVREQLEGHGGLGAEALQPLREEIKPPASTRFGEQRQRGLIIGRDEGIKLSDQFLDRLVPRDVGELSTATLARALARVREAVRMIGHLDRGLAARAQLALADRILGIAFELLGQAHADHAGLAVAENLRIAFHDSRDHAAAGVAQRADAGFPGGNAGHQILFRNEANDLVFGITARGERGSGAGNGGELDEISAVHGAHAQ